MLLAFAACAAPCQAANIRLRSPPAETEKTAAAVPAGGMEYEGYKEEWGKEWRKGEYPPWQEAHPSAEKIAKFEDRQSDGEPSEALGTGPETGAYLPPQAVPAKK